MSCLLFDLLLLSFFSQTNTQFGTGFIGHLPLDGKDTVVLVTVHHVINNMDTALTSDFTFQYREIGQGLVVKGADLFAGCDKIHKSCPPVMVSNCVSSPHSFVLPFLVTVSNPTLIEQHIQL